MSRSRTTEILEAWRTMADSAVLPAEAPRPSRSLLRMSIIGTGGVAVAMLVAVLVWGGSSPSVPGGAPASPSFSSSPAAGISHSPLSTVAAATPSPTSVASPIALPNPGGTCSASQIVVGTPTWASGYGAIGSTSVYVTLPLRNTAADCVLQLPATIGVASATGGFEAASVEDNGTESATGENSPAQSARIRSGGSVSLVLGAWWQAAPQQAENGTPVPVPPCLHPISNVTRIQFPLAAGTIEIELPTVFNEVCASPASMSLTIKGQ